MKTIEKKYESIVTLKDAQDNFMIGTIYEDGKWSYFMDGNEYLVENGEVIAEDIFVTEKKNKQIATLRNEGYGKWIVLFGNNIESLNAYSKTKALKIAKGLIIVETFNVMGKN